EHAMVLRRVAEVISDHRFQHAQDEVADRPELLDIRWQGSSLGLIDLPRLGRADAKDHPRRILASNANDLIDLDLKLISVIRPQTYPAERRVVVPGILGFVWPVERDLVGRDDHHVQDLRVEGVLPWR